MPRRAIVAAACAVSAPLALGAWQGQQVPVFRSAVELVHLDVSVLDRSRIPVRGLTADDFSVFEDGQPQPIVAFSAVDVESPEELSANWMRELPFDVQSNSLAEDGQGRLFVLLIDDAMLPSDPGVLAAARTVSHKFVERLSPADRVAVVFSAAGRSQDFTNDRSRLSEAIDSLSAGYATHLRGWDTAADPRAPEDPTLPTDMEAKGPKMDTDAQWRRASMLTLKQVADTLIAAPQRRKALVFVSPGIAVDHASAAMPMLTHAAAIASMKEANRDLAREMPDLYRRMQHANVTIYPVDPFGGGFEGWVLTAASRVPALRVMTEPVPGNFDFLDASTGIVPPPDSLARHMSSLSLDFLQTSAANTGGFAVINTNDFDAALDRMFLENGAYYLLGYPATPGQTPGSLRRINVRVNRSDVIVRARTGYTTPKTENARDEAGPSPLDVAIEGPVPKGGFPMRIAIAPVAVPGKAEAAVTIALALEQAPVSRRTESLIDLQTNVYRPDGKPVLVGQRHTARVILVPAGGREPARYELHTHVDLKPGRYQLRLSAHRAADVTSGSVFADVEVPDFTRDPLSVSGTIVEALPAMRSAPAGAFDAFLPVVPTTMREFAADDGAVVFMRVYQGGRAPVATVRVHARVLDATDTVVADEHQTLGPDRFYQPGRSADYRFALPLTDLKPGKYAAIFDITSGARSITRGIRFVVK